ncbi:MAG TPA: hypothetical protein VJ572_00515 [Azonexus sp.]|nr:hypothetical protein [Azonexus sp.]
MIADATKDDLAETARILAMQAAHFARYFGELPLPDLAHLLSRAKLDDESVGLLRDGAEALVGVLASVLPQAILAGASALRPMSEVGRDCPTNDFLAIGRKVDC